MIPLHSQKWTILDLSEPTARIDWQAVNRKLRVALEGTTTLHENKIDNEEGVIARTGYLIRGYCLVQLSLEH
jgi:hypothetical protein